MDKLRKMLEAGWTIRIWSESADKFYARATRLLLPSCNDVDVIAAQGTSFADCVESLFAAWDMAAWEMDDYQVPTTIGLPLFEVPS